MRNIRKFFLTATFLCLTAVGWAQQAGSTDDTKNADPKPTEPAKFDKQDPKSEGGWWTGDVSNCDTRRHGIVPYVCVIGKEVASCLEETPTASLDIHPSCQRVPCPGTFV